MLYFFNQFMKKIYIPVWVLLVLWFLLNVITIFDRTLWLQGSTDIKIASIVWWFLVIIFLIIHAIVKSSETMNYYWLVLPFSALFFGIAYGIVITQNGDTREFYTENGHTLMVEERIVSADNSVFYFYEKEGIFAKKVTYCVETSDNYCSYTIINNTLIISELDNDGNIEQKEVTLE